jgi:ATP-dependent helicase/nuclease subunit A
VFTATEASTLDVQKLAGFWTGPIGAEIRGHLPSVRRELPFTARFSPAELEGLAGIGDLDPLEDEFMVVQGVADLVMLGEKEIWLLDFKTDRMQAEDVADKVVSYRPQLQIYAAALTAIYGRPVTRRWLHFLMPGTTIEI